MGSRQMELLGSDAMAIGAMDIAHLQGMGI